MKFRTKIDAENFLTMNDIHDGEVIFNRDLEIFEIRFLSTGEENDLEERTKDLFTDFVVGYEEEALAA